MLPNAARISLKKKSRGICPMVALLLVNVFVRDVGRMIPLHFYPSFRKRYHVCMHRKNPRNLVRMSKKMFVNCTMFLVVCRALIGMENSETTMIPTHFGHISTSLRKTNLGRTRNSGHCGRERI